MLVCWWGSCVCSSLLLIAVVTHLVVYLVLRQRQLHELLKMITFLFELLAFRPVVKCPRYVDLRGRVFPRLEKQWSAVALFTQADLG